MTSKFLNIDTDATLSGNSDTTVASQRAVKTYIDQQIASLQGSGNGGNHLEYLFGNGIDGDIVVEKDTSYDSMKNCGNFTLNAGVTLTKTTSGSPLIIRCTGICTINGTINLAGKGMAGGVAGANGYGYGNVQSGQNTLGGVGLSNRLPSGNIDINAVELAASTFNFSSIPFCGGGGAGAYAYCTSSKGQTADSNFGGIGAGSGGNAQASAYNPNTSTSTASVVGGNGGGGLLIIAKKIVFTGSLIATGTNGSSVNTSSSGFNSPFARGSGGGGGGGCAVFIGSEISLSGNMNFAGGASGGSYNGVSGGAGGMGGYVKLII